VGVFEMEFVGLVVVEIGDEGFPDAAVIDFVEFVGPNIPAIPIADDRDILG
jgi:hypothetical protein